MCERRTHFTNGITIESTGNLEKSLPQIGFEPTVLCELGGCSNHWTTGDSVVSKGLMRVFDSSYITQLPIQMSTA